MSDGFIWKSLKKTPYWKITTGDSAYLQVLFPSNK